MKVIKVVVTNDYNDAKAYYIKVKEILDILTTGVPHNATYKKINLINGTLKEM